MAKIFIPQVESIDKLLEEGASIDELYDAQGRHTKGDGGGGLFRVTQSGAATDGGTVFAFDEDVSAQKTQNISGYGYNLPDNDLVWGEVSIRYASGSTNGRENVLPHKDMHGHTSSLMSNGVAGWIDYKSGKISGPGNTLKNMNIDLGDGSKTYTVRYKHATSTRRLERVGVTNAVNIDWWGAPQADPNNPVSAETELKYALNKAKNLYDSSNYDWVYLDIPGEYYFNLHVRIPDGVMIRGTGPDRNVPNRSFTVNGALTYMPGEALYYKHQDYDRTVENDVYGYMRNQQTHFGNMEAASDKMGLYNIELNGNLDNNEEVITSGEYPGIESYLQNSGDWNAFYTRGKGGESYEKGYPVHIKNVYAHSYGANSFAGGGAGFDNAGAAFEVQWEGGPSPNVHLVDAARNHQVYGVPGSKKDWSIDGHFWASPVKFGSRSDHPSYWEDLELMSAPASPYGFGGMRNVWSTNGVNVEVDGFLMDLSETTVAEEDVEAIATDNNGKYDPSVNGNSGNVYRNITIKTSVDDAATLSRSFGQHAPILWENVTIEDNGMPVNIGTPFNSRVYNITYRNVDVIPQGNLGVLSSAPDRIGVQGYSSNVTNIPNVPEALWRVFDNVNYQRAFDTSFFGFGADQETGLVAFDQWIIDSSFDNRSGGQFFRVATNNVNAIDTSDEWFIMFLDNTTWNMQSDMHQWIEAEIVRMRNVQDREGRTSEETGTYTSDASDEGSSQVVIPTSLVSNPGETSATVTSGAPSVTGVSVQNGPLDPELVVSLDQAIGTGNTIDVDYTARVTPQDKYQTTGLFVARPVADQTYTSGNGPFTVDLRGVAACQESREYIQYSVSSSDTSVVTGSVPTAEYGQPPMLTLTEQGTGTATITVDAEIPGVGTAQTTFDVTIS